MSRVYASFRAGELTPREFQSCVQGLNIIARTILAMAQEKALLSQSARLERPDAPQLVGCTIQIGQPSQPIAGYTIPYTPDDAAPPLPDLPQLDDQSFPIPPSLK